MESDSSISWQRYWGGLRARRLALVAAVPLTLPVWFIAGGLAGFLISVAASVVAVWAVRSWPCPRCGNPFGGIRWSLFSERCVSCALPAFARPDFVRRTDFVRAADLRTLPDGLRRFVAGAEMAGGAAVMALTALEGVGPLWFRLAIESVGATAVAAGVWLWRDDARGYTWSRLVQGLQLVRFSIPPLAYAVSAGPFADVYFGQVQSGFNVGFRGQLVLTWGNVSPLAVSFNMLAAAWLLMLLDARPKSAVVPSGVKQFEVRWSESATAVSDTALPPGPPPTDSPPE
ncbi:MAG TPA: hypothetical protein VJ802_07580 [Gemmatimonadaceae bacterium]|nr:hypothetical protein [Gemmatimonadaceae bacterium]